MQSQEFRESLRKEHLHVSDKDVNWFIHQLEPKQNSREDYQKALTIWNQYLALRKSSVKQANSVLAANTKKSPNSVGSNLCQLCYNQFSRKRHWCHICGSECCQKCVGRMRVVKNEDITVFCEKCDKQYLVAMIIKQDEQNFIIRQKAFTKLADEQQMIQSLLKIEKHKLITSQQKQGQSKNVLLKKMNEITQLASSNQLLRGQISEVNKKIEWGQQIKLHLKKKLKKYKKNQTHSFSSSMHQSHEGWAPPQADAQDYVSVDNLNQSIINSLLQHQTEKNQNNNLKCTCQTF